MSSRLGQSGVEYLATYGWMAVAVTVAGAALYPSLNTGCNVQLDGDIRTGGLAIEQVGADKNGTLKVIFDSDTREKLQVESIRLEGSEDSLTVVQPREISPGGEIAYKIGDVERTSGCDTFDAEITFDKGPLQSQKKQIEISAPYELVKRFLSLIRTRGDSIEHLEVDASVKPTNETICVGLGCGITEGGNATEPEKYLNYSGDSMRGTLRTNRFDSVCYGVKCEEKGGDIEGYVNSNESFMAGTLRLTELMPKNDDEKKILLK
ncbi:hypothetical protein [Candidatus Nanohalobium constans]|nr:hypothetical protein [Candidatus Nanohalobium constans]